MNSAHTYQAEIDLHFHVLAVLTSRLLAVAESEGLDGDALLRDAGLSREDLANPDHYVPIERHVALGSSMTKRLGPVNGGLHSGATIYGDPRGALGFAIRRSGVHSVALQRFCRFLALSNPSSPALLCSTSEGLELRVDMAPGLAALGHPTESLLSAWVAISRFVTGCHYTPVRVTFAHSPKGPTTEHAQFFGCPVHFQAQHSAVVIEATAAAASIEPTAHPFDALLDQLESELTGVVTTETQSQQIGRLIGELRDGGVHDPTEYDDALLVSAVTRFLGPPHSLPRFEAAFLFGFLSVLRLNACLRTG